MQDLHSLQSSPAVSPSQPGIVHECKKGWEDTCRSSVISFLTCPTCDCISCAAPTIARSIAFPPPRPTCTATDETQRLILLPSERGRLGCGPLKTVGTIRRRARTPRRRLGRVAGWQQSPALTAPDCDEKRTRRQAEGQIGSWTGVPDLGARARLLGLGLGVGLGLGPRTPTGGCDGDSLTNEPPRSASASSSSASASAAPKTAN